MSQLPFYRYFIEESNKNRAFAELMDADINKRCSLITDTPIDITPLGLQENPAFFEYSQPAILYIYPSKQDSKDFFLKGEQLIESIHCINNQAVFEIRMGSEKEIYVSFYGESVDIDNIYPALKNVYPNSFFEIADPEIESCQDLFIFDFITDGQFYKSLTSYNKFILSPLNLIVDILKDLKTKGAYQVVFRPVLDGYHELVKEAADCEWRSRHGADREITPSLQTNTANKKLEYKSPDFRSYFSVCVRIILPVSMEASIKAFISNYTYGSRKLISLDNQSYSQKLIQEMFSKRTAYHSGFLVNSHELTSFLHIPFQVLNDKALSEIFASAPPGDKPVKMANYKDISIGVWACGNSDKEIYLPLQREIPHVHILGVSRTGKSVLLSRLALERFWKKEATFVLDPHGDLVENILRMMPGNSDDVIVIDFSLNEATPQLTIRANVDITNPGKVSDDLSESMREITSGREKFWGPRMAYAFQCLYFIYCNVNGLTLEDIRLMVSPTRKGKALRTKTKIMIDHPVIKDFLELLDCIPFEAIAPVITRLSHLLLDEKSLKLFTLEKNRISISDIMEEGKLCLINLACGIIGKQRSSILSGLLDSMISNNILSRANIPYEKRKPCTLIKDEFYLGPGDLDMQFSGLGKYGLSVIVAHQYLDQVDGRTREVIGTAGTKITFRLRRRCAEILGREFDISPEEFTSLRKFQAFVKVEDEVVKVNTPRPLFNKKDYSAEIMKNCLDKYYMRHTDKIKEELSFDVL